MTDYWLSKAAETLRAQIDARWPGRERASDGWIGDASHAAAVSDHNPCWTCTGKSYGVVRALDVDASLGGPNGWNSTADSWALAQQLRAAMIAGDKRVAYIIAWDNERKADYICSMNPAYQPLGVWRPYTGDSHQNHVHVSFTPAGDQDGRPFDLPIFGADNEEQQMQDYIDGTNAAQAAYEKDGKVGSPPEGKGKFFRAGWNDVRWQVNNLRGRDGKDGARGPKGDQGPQGLPGASHSHEKISVAGPAIPTP